MYTATVLNKQETDRGLEIVVQFSNGEKTIQETIVPQDKAGYDLWISSRLESLNTSEQLKTELVIGGTAVTEKPIKETQPIELWLNDYYKLVRVKQTLVDTGIIQPSDAKYTALLSVVKQGLADNPDYFDSI